MSVQKLNKALTAFRSDLVKSTELLNKYKLLYFKECRLSADFHKKLKNANEDLRAKTEEINRLNNNISVLRKRATKNIRKTWSQAASVRTKRRWLTDLKNDFFQILKHFGSVKSAHVSLKIGDNHANFKWFSNDFLRSIQSSADKDQSSTEPSSTDPSSTDPSSTDPSPRDPSSTDHSYNNTGVLHNDGSDPQEEPETDYSDIYHEDGRFTSRHVRKAVYVCDKFRISQEAYHELRMELKGHYPPIWLIKWHKNLMSSRIVYFPHDTVNIFLGSFMCYNVYYSV